MSSIRVSIMVDSVGAYGRNVLAGIAAYARSRTHWVLAQDSIAFLVQAIRAGQTHGVIVQVTDPKLERFLARCGVPVVNVSFRMTRSSLPRVINDDAVVGQMVAEYFLARGFVRFAFVGMPPLAFSWQRGEAFAAAVRQQGGSCTMLNHVRQNRRFRPIKPWLVALPKPCAIMAADDYMGRQVVNVAVAAGFRVPEDVAVVGVENDPMCSAFCSVPLSSVQTGAERVGQEAARLLDRMLHGELPPTESIRIPPVQVVTRRSSDIIAVEDPVVRAVLEFIREQAGGSLRAADVVGTVPLSRRMVELRFRKAMGRSIEAEILRVRLDRAKRLLAGSNQPIAQVAAAAGFAEPRYLSICFRKAFSLTPSDYRRQFHLA